MNEKLSSLFSLAYIVMIIVLPLTINAYAQPTALSSQAQAIQNRTYGPEAANTTMASINITNTINNTASEGIQSMRVLLNLLEPDIKRFQLTQEFNDVVMAFSNIQGNLTVLQQHTNNLTTTATAEINQLQQQLQAAQSAASSAATTTSDDDDDDDDDNDGDAGDGDDDGGGSDTTETSDSDTADSPSSSSDTTTGSSSSSSSEVLEGLVSNGAAVDSGPRLDPEGDGGFPGDIDG